jgi:hypothetical protein
LNIEINTKTTKRETVLSGCFFKLPEQQHANLTTKTITRVRKFFNKETPHRPSEEMCQALEDIALTLEKMVDGEADNKIYLSSLAPGIGKTQTICFFLNLLLKDEQYRDQGILIGLSTYDEIESYIERMGVDKSNMAILTSDKKLNGLGNSNQNEAQVLFTTQQRMDIKLKQYENFSKAHEFYYKGKPRQIRIWDESFLPGKPITTRRDDLLFLIGALRRTHQDLAVELDELLNVVLMAAQDKTLIDLPNLKEKHDLSLNELTGLLKKQGKTQTEIGNASNFWFLLGRSVSVRKDGLMGSTALSYEETMPDDISPLLVLDASGNCRATYDEMVSHRNNVVRLKTADKDHSDLEVHHWITGGGKSSFHKRADEYVDGIANTINNDPDKSWLIIIHKDIENLEDRIKSLLEYVDLSKVHFITWGNHRATNKYAEVDRVILAGTLYYSPSQYESLGRLAAGRPPEDGEYPKSSINRIALGELKHVILQGACRGAVRLCKGSKCRPCKIFIMGAKSSGVKPELFQELFPKSTYHLWRPITRELTGKVKAAMDYLRERFSDPEEDFVHFTDVMDAIGMVRFTGGTYRPDRANFNKNIRKHTEFQIALSEAGLREWSINSKRINGFTRSFDPDSITDWERFDGDMSI